MRCAKPVVGSMNKVFYFTDIHGNLKLFDAAIKYCEQIDPNYTLIFGGDAIDRGEDGYKIMETLLNNPHVIYLKGNHEDMFVAAAREFKQHFPNPQFDEKRLDTILSSTLVFDYKYPALQLSITNHGKQTIKDWFLDGLNTELIDKLDKLPLTYSYKNLDFCHAGGVYPGFAAANKDKFAIENLLWNRTAFDYGWAPERICIHGHTPTVAMPRKYSKNMLVENAQPIKYRGDFDDKYTGYKINMDTGAIWSNRLYLLDCDSLTFTLLDGSTPEVQITENAPIKCQ